MIVCLFFCIFLIHLYYLDGDELELHDVLHIPGNSSPVPRNLETSSQGRESDGEVHEEGRHALALLG